MLADFVHAIVEIIQFLWPMRLVHEWERAGWYICGRWRGETGPGLKFVLPWFVDVKTVSTAAAYAGTGRQDVTLTDGRTLSFAATARVHVKDVQAALNAVDDYASSTQEALAAVLAEELGKVDAERMEPNRRGRLFGSLLKAVQDETEKFGVEVESIRFTSFVINPKTLRLLIDQSSATPW